MSLRAAFEDILGVENLINPVTGTTESEIVEILEDVQEKENEVTKTAELVEILEEESAALESLIGSVNTEVGMTRTEATLFTAAFESICRRCYIQTDSVSAALEDIGGTKDRLTASLEAVDSGKNILVRMWEAIKAAVKKAYLAVKNWLKSLFGATKAIEQKCDENIKEANALPADAELEVSADTLGDNGEELPELRQVTAIKEKELAELKKINKAEEDNNEALIKALQGPSSALPAPTSTKTLPAPNGGTVEVDGLGNRKTTKAGTPPKRKRYKTKAKKSDVIKHAEVGKAIAKEVSRHAEVVQKQIVQSETAIVKAEASALKETDPAKAKEFTAAAKTIVANVGKGSRHGVQTGYQSAREIATGGKPSKKARKKAA